jgi:D-beta-D-heptose 7-phosphate kinase/D-beta-D-heptose 1-phosphate adenosyltransferase
MRPRVRSPREKIFLEPELLLRELAAMKARGETIVFANGCFELLHVGHVRYLAAARALGDALVLAVNTDESMRLIKPDRRPVIPDHERFELLAAIEAVDFIVPLRERTPAELLGILKPDIHTKGTDYTIDRIPERVVVEAYGGRVAIVGDPKEHSTTSMLERLRRQEERHRAPAEGTGANGRRARRPAARRSTKVPRKDARKVPRKRSKKAGRKAPRNARRNQRK